MCARRALPILALSVAAVALAPACHDSASPTEPPVAASPTPTPGPACARVAGSYFRGIADSTCLGFRHAGGPTVLEVAPCVFRAEDALLQATVTLTAAGNTGTVTLAWWGGCTGPATGHFSYSNGNVVGSFAGVANGSNANCCGSTSGSFQWLERR